MNYSKNNISKYIAVLLVVFLAGCGGIFDPKGYIAYEQKKIILMVFFVMLGVAVPVFIMAFVFAFKYNEKRNNPNYEPNWDHNTKLEWVIWGIPVIIIMFFAVVAWNTSHSLDPKKNIDVAVSAEKPIVIQAVSLDWKWLFIYPDHGIATINYIEIPENTPVIFKITSDVAMNALWIPQLGGMIYSMAAMETNLNLIADEIGTYDGVSSSYSGFGFSGMQFKVNSVSSSDFNKWVSNVKTSSIVLNNATYDKLLEPTEFHPVTLMKLANINLFDEIIQKYTTHNVDTSRLKH